MQRISSQPRPNWRETVEAQGLVFHSPDEQTYWDESAYYQFDSAQIDELEKASYELDRMCLAAVDRAIENRQLDRFRIPPAFGGYIAHSWDVDEITIVGRFDLAYDGIGPPKLLEYNADTPTSLLEAAVVQWEWFKETGRGKDQFNSIHERLIEAWKRLPANQKIHFAAITDDIEDFVTTTYLQDTAQQAGLTAAYLDIQSLGWDANRKLFVDENAQPVRRCFKLYPWEWMVRESFGPNIIGDSVAWLEPPWKMLLSNKEILVLLWEMFPGSPYLLPAYHEAPGGSYVKKPILSREGANVSIVQNGRVVSQTQGAYGDQPCIYQQFYPFPDFDGNHAVLGSWMINGYAAGIGIREDSSLVTGNRSRFVPHVIQ